MKKQTLGSIAKFAEAELSAPLLKDEPIVKVCTDSRTMHYGYVFMPLKGLKYDGHEFIPEVFRKGALATFCDSNYDIDDTETVVLRVNDTNEAFERLAHNYRMSLKDIKIIGITGSNGKTTTKDIINSVLEKKFKTKKTFGNLNNNIGVPRTLLELDEDTQIGIVEMGMDKFKDISHLVDLARPDISVITNVGHVHLEELKTVENVAKAKLEILDKMDENGLFIYNIDDEVLKAEVLKMDIKPRVISFGTSEEADFKIELLKSDASGNEFKVNGKKYKVNLVGKHQIYNACVAIIIGNEFGQDDKDIQNGLKIENATGMRSELISCEGFDILNDSYKSNPPSLERALETMGLLSGYRQKIAIIGDMLELGEDAILLHKKAGDMINPDVFDYVFLIGDLSKYIAESAREKFGDNSDKRVRYYTKKQDLVDDIKSIIKKNSIVLVKASRAMKMEDIVESLKEITLM